MKQVIVNCPICRQKFIQHAELDVIVAHLDKADHTCPTSGHQIGIAA